MKKLLPGVAIIGALCLTVVPAAAAGLSPMVWDGLGEGLGDILEGVGDILKFILGLVI